MSNGSIGYTPPRDPLRPAAQMAALLQHELGVVIKPTDIVELFRLRWDRLSVLAHHIHGALPR